VQHHLLHLLQLQMQRQLLLQPIASSCGGYSSSAPSPVAPSLPNSRRLPIRRPW
jgi:hypothetical protein